MQACGLVDYSTATRGQGVAPAAARWITIAGDRICRPAAWWREKTNGEK